MRIMVAQCAPEGSGTFSIFWDWMSGPAPEQSEEITNAAINNFSFEHSCHGIVHYAEGALWCRNCGVRLSIGKVETLGEMLTRFPLPRP
jgi:hypothetical protein